MFNEDEYPKVIESQVLDQYGKPYAYIQYKQPVGFKLTKKETNG